jgi:hypothetical protein
MKSTPLLIITLMAVVMSCDSQDPVDLADAQQLTTGLGDSYSGIFFRDNPNIDSKTANVTLNFNGNEFSGQSDIIKYPGICHGNFSVLNGEIEFVNQCPWTAEFDWTLILHGKFKAEIRGDSLYLTKKIDEETTDHYHLIHNHSHIN